MTRMTLAQDARHAFQKLRDFKFVILSSLIDILFVLLLGFFLGPVRRKLIVFFELSGMVFSEQIQQFTASGENSIISFIWAQPEFQKYSLNIVGLFLVLGVIVYLLYSFLQGINWRLAYRRYESVAVRPYFLSFFKINVVWILVYAVYHFLSLFADVNQLIAEKLSGVAGFSLLKIVSSIILIALVYFATLSYTQLKHAHPLRRAFHLGIQHWKTLVPLYLFVCILFALVQYLLIALYPVNKTVWMILGIALIFPLFAYTRLFIFERTRRIA